MMTCVKFGKDRTNGKEWVQKSNGNGGQTRNATYQKTQTTGFCRTQEIERG